VKDYAIFTMDVEGRILTWNSGAEHIKGYRADEIIGKPFSVFYTPEDVRQRKPQKALRRAVAEGVYEGEGWRVRKDGSRFWARATITALRDSTGKLRGYGKVTRDMSRERAAEEALQEAVAALRSKCRERTVQLVRTNGALRAEIRERRRAEENLQASLQQLRSLSGYVQTLREEERKRISREVHDELGQTLTAIKMDLAWFVRNLPAEQEVLREKMKSTLQLVDETVQSVRRIAAELRPGVLDDLGLAAAIEWQVQEFQARTGITIHVRMPPEDIALDPNCAVTLFRIFQEVLRNIAQHAQATQVHVRLMRSNGTVMLETRDNGKGISERQISSPQSLGLLGMKERVLLLGGQFEIHGEEGKGTTVVVQIPVECH
jgi:PAS domain S-box-containing protein